MAAKTQQQTAPKGIKWGVLGRVIGLSRPFKTLFIGTTILSLCLAALTPMTPYLIQQTVDVEVLNYDYDGLLVKIGLLIIVLFSHSITQYLFIYSSRSLGQKVVESLRNKVFRHHLKLNMRYFDTTPVGQSTTRTISDVETINDVFAQGIIQITSDIITLLAVLGVMFSSDWKLTLWCVATLPFLFLATIVFKNAVKKSFIEVRNKVSQMNSFLQEHISGVKIIQLFAAEQIEQDKFEKINKEHTKANVKAIWAYAVFFPVVEIILSVSMAMIVWKGAYNVLSTTTTLGTLVAFLMYLNLLFRPIRMLADKFNTLQMGLVSAERVFKVIDNNSRIEDVGDYKTASLRGDIDFDKVNFAYDGENQVLYDISFSVKQGETIAIVGSTGSGKTTLINVINRFYDIQEGEIKIDGENISNYELDDLRGHICNVLQDVFLFDGTIYENISLRKPEISRKMVEAAAKACGVHEYLMKFPGGYDFEVKERGGTLSQGQKQILSFIRALVHKPEILILDEATSAIDPETEAVLQKATEEATKGRTSLIIAHRLSTIRHADRIIVMEQGRIAEIGTQTELLAMDNGKYKKLYELQLKNLKLA